MSSDNETERRYLQLYWQERAKNERLKNALDEYGTHKPTCRIYKWDLGVDTPCTCGLNAAMEAE